jgi:hypothetical protein
MLWIRAYNVLFGDCYLISWKEGADYHHAWVDFGNFHNDKDAVFDIVYDDVLRRTDGHVDLVIITHRHRDHFDGFYTRRGRFTDDKWQIDRLWTAHVTPSLDHMFRLVDERLSALLSPEAREGLGAIGEAYQNNVGADTDLGLGNVGRMEEIVDKLRPARHVAVHRQMNLGAQDAIPPGFNEMSVDVLAPEQDSDLYLQNVAHSFGFALAADDPIFPMMKTRPRPRGSVPAPDSPWASLADFARLRRHLMQSDRELLAASTTTRNNTSVVARFTYHGRSILMTGDAELDSWDLMQDAGLDLAADLMKVAHHGSINASPTWGFEVVFPARRPGNKVIVSTDSTRYTGPFEVPKKQVLDGWRKRVTSKSRMKSTDGLPLGASIAFYYRD